MKQVEITRFESANPTDNGASPPTDLFDTIVGERLPADVRSSREARAHRGRTWRICVAFLAALLIGTGVSWAATGEPPTRLLFGHELGEGLSAGKKDEVSDRFSVLESADRDAVSVLPEQALRILQATRLRRVIPPGAIPDHYKVRTYLDPATITAIGNTRTASGAVTVAAIDNQVCAFWVGLGGANCGTPSEINSRGVITVGHIGPGGALTAVGLVNDQVTAIRIEGTNRPDQPVTDNIFEITDLPEPPIALVGIGHDGETIFRRPLK